MCLGGGSTPSAPTNPAPYSLENAYTAVEKTTKPRTQEDTTSSTTDELAASTKNPTAPTVTGGAGTNFTM